MRRKPIDRHGRKSKRQQGVIGGVWHCKLNKTILIA